MSPTTEQLWQFVASRRQGVLATINNDGSPQLSNVLYVGAADRLVRISTTADRVKARNLARDPRAALHVAGDDFWHYAVAHGTAALSPAATATGDHTTEQLFAVHRAFYGELDRDGFDEDMIANKRLVATLRVTRLHGVMTSACAVVGTRARAAASSSRASSRPRTSARTSRRNATSTPSMPNHAGSASPTANCCTWRRACSTIARAAAVTPD